MTVTSMPESNLNLSWHLTLTSSLQGFLACVSNLFLQKPLLYPSLLLFISPCLFGLQLHSLGLRDGLSQNDLVYYLSHTCHFSHTFLEFFSSAYKHADKVQLASFRPIHSINFWWCWWNFSSKHFLPLFNQLVLLWTVCGWIKRATQSFLFSLTFCNNTITFFRNQMWLWKAKQTLTENRSN